MSRAEEGYRTGSEATGCYYGSTRSTRSLHRFRFGRFWPPGRATNPVAPINPCAIVPAYDAERTVGDVVRDVLARLARARRGLRRRRRLARRHGARPRARRGRGSSCTPRNRGKGAALAHGMAAPRPRDGFDVAVTVDADGQHPAARGRAACSTPTPDPRRARPRRSAISCATARRGRTRSPTASPTSSSRSSRAAALADTQCGLRRYPLPLRARARRPRRRLRLRGRDHPPRHRRAASASSRCPVRVVYPPAGERVTHFDSVRDPARIVVRVVKTLALTAGLRRAPRRPVPQRGRAAGSRPARSVRPREVAPAPPGDARVPPLAASSRATGRSSSPSRSSSSARPSRTASSAPRTRIEPPAIAAASGEPTVSPADPDLRVLGPAYARHRGKILEVRLAGTPEADRPPARPPALPGDGRERGHALRAASRTTSPSRRRAGSSWTSRASSSATSTAACPTSAAARSPPRPRRSRPIPTPASSPRTTASSSSSRSTTSRSRSSTRRSSAAPASRSPAARPRAGTCSSARNFDFEAGPIFDEKKAVFLVREEGRIPYASVVVARPRGRGDRDERRGRRARRPRRPRARAARRGRARGAHHARGARARAHHARGGGDPRARRPPMVSHIVMLADAARRRRHRRARPRRAAVRAPRRGGKVPLTNHFEGPLADDPTNRTVEAATSTRAAPPRGSTSSSARSRRAPPSSGSWACSATAGASGGVDAAARRPAHHRRAHRDPLGGDGHDRARPLGERGPAPRGPLRALRRRQAPRPGLRAAARTIRVEAIPADPILTSGALRRVGARRLAAPGESPDATTHVPPRASPPPAARSRSPARRAPTRSRTRSPRSPGRAPASRRWWRPSRRSGPSACSPPR